MLKKDLENIKPISEKSLNSYINSLKEKGQCVSNYGTMFNQLYLINVADYSKNDIATKSDLEDEPVKYYYNSGDPSCILSRMQCFDSPYKCFFGGYSRFSDCHVIYNEELTIDQVSQCFNALKEWSDGVRNK